MAHTREDICISLHYNYTHLAQIIFSLYNLANAEYLSGRLTDALLRYDELLEAFPEHVAGRHNRELLVAELAPQLFLLFMIAFVLEFSLSPPRGGEAALCLGLGG